MRITLNKDLRKVHLQKRGQNQLKSNSEKLHRKLNKYNYVMREQGVRLPVYLIKIKKSFTVNYKANDNRSCTPIYSAKTW